METGAGTGAMILTTLNPHEVNTEANILRGATSWHPADVSAF